MPPDGPIERSVLGDQIKDRLLQEILAGRYAPGERIVETRVARELGTSQAPVREALRDLEALGVVEINAFKGARVRRPAKAELEEAYAIRAELEGLAARLAMPKMTEADFDELDGYLADMKNAAIAGDVHAGAMADVAFHARVVEMSGNRTLERLWRHLEPASRTYITLVSASNVQRIADLHAPILAALRERDPERATAAYREHFEMAGKFVDQTWEDAPAAAQRQVPVLNGTIRTAAGETRPASLGFRVGLPSDRPPIDTNR
jgi:DNA-binding GntR family transcriptional regulator